MILAGGDSFTKKSPGAMVCRCYGKNCENVLQRFGGAEVAMACIEGRLRLTGVFREIRWSAAYLITGHMACFGCLIVH